MLSGALIGAGNIARNGHLPAYLGDPTVAARLRIDAIADPCPENRAAIAALLPNARTYACADELLDRERLDFVDVCTPPFLHRPIVERALAAGCHVLCEKPLATDLPDALAIRDAALRHRRVVMPCHQYHHAPQWRMLRQLLTSGGLGEVRLGLLTVLRTGANAGNAAWCPSWRTEQRLAGGGILVDHGTHLFYQLHSVFGPPADLVCRTERRLPGICVDDTVTLYLRYPRRLVRVHLSWAARRRHSSHRYFGARGEAALLDDRIRVRHRGTEREITFDEGISHGSAHSAWFGPLLAEFADRVADNDLRADRIDEAVVTAAYITRAYASSLDTGRPVAWTDPLRAPAAAYAAAD